MLSSKIKLSGYKIEVIILIFNNVKSYVIYCYNWVPETHISFKQQNLSAQKEHFALFQVEINRKSLSWNKNEQKIKKDK